MIREFSFKAWHKDADGSNGPVSFPRADGDLKRQHHGADNSTVPDGCLPKANGKPLDENIGRRGEEADGSSMA